MAVVVVITSAVLGGLFGGRVLAGQDNLSLHYESFTTALAAIEDTYVGEADSEQLVYRAIGGMLQTLDPHSNFMDPRSYAQLRERQEGHYYGLGISINVIDGGITVMNIFEGSPAFRRGLRRGDVIARIAGTDALGMTVNLGPFLYPLRDRPDILARMRMFVTAHGETTHQSGVPYALCGHRRNTPRLAGTGAHVEAHLRAVDGPSALPRSYVFLPGLSDLSGLNADSAAAIGLQRASARPMTLRLNAGGVDTEQLLRTVIGGTRGAIDRLVDHSTQRYASRLVDPSGTPVRSARFDDFAAARDALGTTPDVVGLLSAQALAAREGSECEQHSGVDYTSMGLQASVELMTHPTSPARYVTCVDGGLAPASGGGAYDTHFFHVSESARNVVHMSRELVSRINEPGEGDPRKLDLDRHMILLTTEYGRSPLPIAGGLDHWPYGYVTIAIGGPVTPDHAGIIGAIDDQGIATSAFTPGDQRAALLLALGIWPFSDRSFAVGDISAGATELDCAMYLREQLWGYPA